MNIEAFKTSGKSEPIEVHFRIEEDVDGLVWNIYWAGGRPKDVSWLSQSASDISDKDFLVDGEMVKEDLGPGEYIAVLTMRWYRSPGTPDGPGEWDEDLEIHSLAKVN